MDYFLIVFFVLGIFWAYCLGHDARAGSPLSGRKSIA